MRLRAVQRLTQSAYMGDALALGLGGCARAGRRQAWEVVALLRVAVARRDDAAHGYDGREDRLCRRDVPGRSHLGVSTARQLNHAQRSGSTGRLE